MSCYASLFWISAPQYWFPLEVTRHQPGGGQGLGFSPAGSGELLGEVAFVGADRELSQHSSQTASCPGPLQLLTAILAASSWLLLPGPALCFLCVKAGVAGTEPL